MGGDVVDYQLAEWIKAVERVERTHWKVDFVAAIPKYVDSVTAWFDGLISAERDAATGAQATTALYVGDGRCRVGENLVRLEETEMFVVEALVNLQGANKSELIDASGVNDAPRVLRRVTTKYPLLAEHITLPGRRGAGGFSTTIRPA